MKQTKEEKICCGVLEKMDINWMVMEDGTKLMPFIKGEKMINYRVNHCPSCGIYIRDCKILKLPK